MTKYSSNFKLSKHQGYKQRTINTGEQKKETRQQATQLQSGVKHKSVTIATNKESNM